MNNCQQCNSKQQAHCSCNNQPKNTGQQSCQNIVYHGFNTATQSNSQALSVSSFQNGCNRPIDSGIFRAVDHQGRPVPFAKVTVTYHGTNNLVALYSGDKKDVLIPNPIITNEYGRVAAQYSGGPVDVLVERLDENGDVCETVERFTNQGGFLDCDFPLSEDELLECVSIESPRLRIYDENNQNIPSGLVTPEQISQWGAFKLGLPIGTYSEAVKFYDCIGRTFECGTIIRGDTDGVEYRYNCENCNQALPPDPETQTFNQAGISTCWTRARDFDSCTYEEATEEELENDPNPKVVACVGGETRLVDFQSGFTSVPSGIQDISDSSLSSGSFETGTLTSAPPNSVALVDVRLATLNTSDDERYLTIRDVGSTRPTFPYTMGLDGSAFAFPSSEVAPQVQQQRMLIPLDENSQFQYAYTGATANSTIIFVTVGYFQ